MEEKTNCTEKQEKNQKWECNKKYLIVLLSWTMGTSNLLLTPELFRKGNLLDFIIAYIPLVVFMGIPLTFLELGLSQYTKRSTGSWRIGPAFQGIGYSKIVLITIFQIYYNVMNSYILKYMFTSFSKTVEWKTCNASWANGSCYDNYGNTSGEHRKNHQTSVEQFWFNHVLSWKDNFTTVEGPHWDSALYLTLNMFLIFIVNNNGTKLIEKILPYILIISSIGMLIVTYAALVSSGSIEGLKEIINMEIHPDTLLPWKANSMALDIFCNILYTMGLGFGGFSTIAAQSSFRSPLYGYVILLNLANFATTILYAVVVFSFYGIVNRHSKISMNEIMQKHRFGNDLFTVFPSAILYLPRIPQIWIFFFYSSIFLTGLSSSILMAMTVLQTIYEIKPNFMKKSTICSLCFSLFTYASGLILHMNIGIIISTYLKEITRTTILPLINWFQVIAIVYFYGLLNFSQDIHFMMGIRTPVYWKSGLVISSVILTTFTVLSVTNFSQENYFFQFHFITVLHILVLTITLFWIPFMIGVGLVQKKCKKKLFTNYLEIHHSDELRRSRIVFSKLNFAYEYVYEQNLLNNKLKKYEI